MIQCPLFLTPKLPAYVAVIILIIFKETAIGGSGKGNFAWCVRALSWIKFLKKHIACAFSLVSFPQISSWSRDTQASRETFESQGILFPKRLSFHKGWCCGSQWKRIAEVWRVVWVVGGGGFREKWWVPFDSLVGLSCWRICWLIKIIDGTKISPVGYRGKPLFEDLMWFFLLSMLCHFAIRIDNCSETPKCAYRVLLVYLLVHC